MSPEPKKLLDQVREIIRLKHYSRKTEKTYVSWIRRFILFHGKKHPHFEENAFTCSNGK
ncbi:MAG: hypothetical protein HOC74_29975 [Gemmatimonadetes bacterium]|jgi:hypothetical protein|nr:hypothetical protein [Gemmatimonadota bacterium]MBT7913092.1 hypothetical protein [Candidatus Bathyarchaeota archaeon]